VIPVADSSRVEEFGISEDEQSWLNDMANWTLPIFPRNQVDRAGEVLVGKKARPPDEPDPYWEFRVVNNWRDAHNYPLAKVKANLKGHARKVRKKNIQMYFHEVLVASRNKRLASIKSKLHRFPTMQLSQMQDIAGCRAVMRSIKEVRDLVSLNREKSPHLSRAEKNYINDPKKDGYRSHHLIYQFQDRPMRDATYNALRFELQVRTELQHTWATAVEAVGLLTGQALKSNIGSKDWRRLFALTSSEMATREGLPPIKSLPVKESDRIQEMRDLTERLRAVETLKVAQAAIGFVADESFYRKRGAGYFLVSYDYR
jgi:ppGpp synthetase/RelA/SpoT-type nucleotidyltranferase